MRVLLTGSRDWTDREIIWRDLESDWAQDPAGFVLVHGACKTGADAIAQEWAVARGIEPERYPVTKAHWHALGLSAGPKRNAYMVSLGADLCRAYVRNNSRGASGTVELARAANIEVIVRQSFGGGTPRVRAAR